MNQKALAEKYKLDTRPGSKVYFIDGKGGMGLVRFGEVLEYDATHDRAKVKILSTDRRGEVVELKPFSDYYFHLTV